MIRPLLRRAAHAASDRVVGPWLFDLYRREKLARREFFYDAFKALRFNGIEGDYAEFGSWGGMTFALAYEESRRHGHGAKLWAFDSFQGFPTPREADAHPEWAEGKMAITLEQFRAVCANHGIPDDAYTVVAGFYEETLAMMSATEEPTDIALAYVDCEREDGARVPSAAAEARDDRRVRRLLLLVELAAGRRAKGDAGGRRGRRNLDLGAVHPVRVARAVVRHRSHSPGGPGRIRGRYT